MRRGVEPRIAQAAVQVRRLQARAVAPDALIVCRLGQTAAAGVGVGRLGHALGAKVLRGQGMHACMHVNTRNLARPGMRACMHVNSRTLLTVSAHPALPLTRCCSAQSSSLVDQFVTIRVVI